MLDKFRKIVNSYKWTFAKTYAKTAPHEYLVKGKLKPEDQKIFEDIVIYIRTHGEKRMFFSKEFTYFKFEGHEYWTYGNPLDQTIILNRVNI